MHPYLDAPTPLAFAHRGGAAEGDENTVTAFGRAVALGYRYIETDTHSTADGVPVVFHDDTLDRVLGRPGRVAEVTMADLSTARVGGEPVVPRLTDVLHAWPGIRFNIDVKADNGVAPTVAAVAATGTRDRVLLASFSDARLARIRRACGPAQATSMGQREVAALWLASRIRAPRDPGGHTDRRPYRLATAGVVAAQVPVHHGWVRVVDARFVRAAHARGLQVHVWTIDEAAEIRELLDLGVDGIMTDHIEVLRQVYAQRGCWLDDRPDRAEPDGAD